MLYTSDIHPYTYHTSHIIHFSRPHLLKNDCSQVVATQTVHCIPDWSHKHNESDIPGNTNDDISDKLNKIRRMNLDNVIIGFQNVNSLNSKFDDIKCIVPGNIDVMIFVERKLDDSFPTSQFSMNGFVKPFRRDRNKFGGTRRHSIPNFKKCFSMYSLYMLQ